MNKQALTEADIRTKFITPALVGANGDKWNVMTQIREEAYFTKGRVIVRGKTVKRGEAKKADYILSYKPNLPIAVIEAKDNNHAVGAGMQRALEYAEILDVPFAYSSNGDAFLEHDRTITKGTVTRELALDQFPTPAELWARYANDLPGDVVAKHAVLKGDILFSHINSEPHLGKTAICTIDDPALVHGVNLLLLRPIAGIDSGYLNIALRELRVAGYFVSIAQRAVNQASINQKNLGKTPIPVPPLAEQCRIVAKVEQLMALVDALETQLAASRATAANLLSALVAELTAASATRKSANGAAPSQPGATPQVKGRKQNEG